MTVASSPVTIGLLGGLITSISPCILPVFPVILLPAGVQDAYGDSGDDRGDDGGFASRFHPCPAVTGLATSLMVFTLLGSTVLSPLHLLQNLVRWIGIVTPAPIDLGMMVPKVMEILERSSARFQCFGGSKNPSNGFPLGLVLGVTYVLRAGPILAAVAAAKATGRTGADTVTPVVSLAVGTVIPLLTFALAGRGITERTRAFYIRQRVIRVTAGAVILGLVVVLVLDALAALQRHLPDYTASLQTRIDDLLHDDSASGSCRPGAATLGDYGSLPAIGGAVTRINTPGDQPLTQQSRAGKITLINLFAYSYINCQHPVPGIGKLYETCATSGLQAIGVHSPEYILEKRVDNVRDDVKRLGTTYPAVVGSNLATWTNFDNHYWLVHYLIDAQSNVRQTYVGEGREAATEKLVRELFVQANPKVTLPAPVFSEVKDDAGVNSSHTPETCLGFDRASGFAQGTLQKGQYAFSFPSRLQTDTFALDGTQTMGPQSVTPTEGKGHLRLSYRGKQANLVVPGEGDPTWVVNGKTHTTHVPDVPNGMELVRSEEMGSGELELGVSPGLQLYSFIFGWLDGESEHDVGDGVTSLAMLEAWTGTRAVSAHGLAYHSSMTRSSCTGSEGKWIVQVADGDADAFARLYDAWSSRLFTLIVQIVVDRVQNEEVLQEVFLEVWRTADSYSPARGSARVWLVAMARRRVVDRVRLSQSSQKRESRWRDYMPDIDQTAQQVEDKLAGKQVHQVLGVVGELYRPTIELVYFTNLTHREIARRTGTPLGTVKTRIRDGMVRLRRELGVRS